jgi:hypothetical protein
MESTLIHTVRSLELLLLASRQATNCGRPGPALTSSRCTRITTANETEKHQQAMISHGLLPKSNPCFTMPT